MTDSLNNGEVWEVGVLRAVTQWITGDTWILLGVPDKAVHGGTCMVAHTDKTGKATYSHDELAEQLHSGGWHKSTDRVVSHQNDVAWKEAEISRLRELTGEQAIDFSGE